MTLYYLHKMGVSNEKRCNKKMKSILALFYFYFKIKKKLKLLFTDRLTVLILLPPLSLTLLY